MVNIINRIERSEKSYFYAEGDESNLEDEKGQFYITSRIIKDRNERIREETFNKIEEIYRKEIHHRIKNNLQVISSLLSLQASYFKDTEVLEAFRKTQNRVISMALIHEELYESENQKTLDFTAYLRKLTEELFNSYGAQNSRFRLQMDVEEHIFLDMDTAIPLGMIVNELVTNSLKHAFPICSGGEVNEREINGGEINIRFYRMRTDNKIDCQINSNLINSNLINNNIINNDLINDDKVDFVSKNSAKPGNFESSRFTLIVSDNGSGFSEGIDFENPDTLGLQLVKILVEQINGKIEFKREQVTEVKIEFYDCISRFDKT